MTGRVHYCQGQTIFIKSGCKIIPVFPVYRDQTPYYPIVAGYCFTIHKIMGQTLKHITLVFDTRHLAPDMWHYQECHNILMMLYQSCVYEKLIL